MQYTGIWDKKNAPATFPGLMTTVLGNVPNSNTKLYLRKESCRGQVRPTDAKVFENIEDRKVRVENLREN